MDELELIKHLREQNEQLKRENEMLKAKIRELEARLAQYENAHTPPSLKRGRNRKRDDGLKGKPGQKEGHKGTTRSYCTPDSQVEVTMDRCPDCKAKLGNPIRIESKIIEEIPEPQPAMVIEYQIAHYRCPRCKKEAEAKNPAYPHKGRFGNNVIAQTTLLKYEDRLPHRKIQDAMKRLHGLNISPATIFELTNRAADALQSDYNEILNRIRNAPILYVDETGIRVQGEQHWIWTFTTPTEIFYAIRKSRGISVLEEVLTNDFKGLIVCDGWKPYAKFTNRLQRCWAHLLRESKHLAEKFEEAVPLHNGLKEIYELVIKSLEADPPPEIRTELCQLARESLRHWLIEKYSSEQVKKFIGKIENGFDYWFNFIINPGVEPTNNRAERALRTHVVMRKIMGTLRNYKGTSIHERVMTALETWGLCGMNCLQMITARLAS